MTSESLRQSGQIVSGRSSGRTVECRDCGPLPAGEPLFDIAGEQFHAVMVRAARGWESYNGPEPAEYEPCGPVAAAPENAEGSPCPDCGWNHPGRQPGRCGDCGPDPQQSADGGDQ